MGERLTEEAISDGMVELREWKRDGDRIQRKLEFANFYDAIAFINRIAPLANAADHHPEIFNVYNRVDLTLTTHDADGLTQKDLDLAAEIDGVVEA